MSELFEQLISLLGKPHNDPGIAQLTRRLEEEPRIINDSKESRYLLYPITGLFLVIDKDNDEIERVSLSLSNCKRPVDDLIAGITTIDSPTTVREKLSRHGKFERREPGSSETREDYSEYFWSEIVELSFDFDSETREMKHVCARWTLNDVVTEDLPFPPTLTQQCAQEVLQSIAQGRSEARRLHHEIVGPEFVLLGLLRYEGSVPSAAFGRFGVNRQRVRSAVELAVGKKPASRKQDIPIAKNVQKIIENASIESLKLNSDKVYESHMLLGLIEQQDPTILEVLKTLNIAPDQLRAEVLKLILRA
ncbi:MAG TPA: Clp protease N-terminal domain-containing protein [Chroococcales cyanobacterium]